MRFSIRRMSGCVIAAKTIITIMMFGSCGAGGLRKNHCWWHNCGRVRQYLQRFVSEGGVYTDIQQGISLGCPLSPLMGALYLKPLDDLMAQMGCFYVRYMDDWVVLAQTRWALRRAIKATNQVLDELLVEKHPDKTYIGRISRGFDFLGYRFASLGLGVAWVTVERFVERVSRLYEQGATASRIGEYACRWWRWVRAGLLGRLIGAGLDWTEIMWDWFLSKLSVAFSDSTT